MKTYLYLETKEKILNITNLNNISFKKLNMTKNSTIKVFLVLSFKTYQNL